MAPPRVYRYWVRNQTPDHRLDLISSHLCWGDWTPGWQPPATIPPGGERGFQGESGGPVTGTEGWVKYGITRSSDGAVRGLLYAYWNNPFMGVTSQRFGISGSDVRADCDPDEGSGGSTFGMPTSSTPPADLRIALSSTRRNGVPTNVDEMSDLYKIPLAPIVIFGMGGIWERVEAQIDLRSVPTSSAPLFPGPATGTRSLKLMREPDPKDWAGSWSGRSVDVSVDPSHRIVQTFGPASNSFIVTMRDRTPQWPLEHTETCLLEGEEIPAGLAKTMVDAVSVSDSLSSDTSATGKAKVALAALNSAVIQVSENPTVESPHDSTAVKRYAMELKSAAQLFGAQDSETLDLMSHGLAALVNRKKFTLFPYSGVTLQLYKEQLDGKQVNTLLRYVRMTGDGMVFTDEYLSWHPDVN